ncbi:MAG TPA: hypothetical protein VK327_09390 [Candidatus Paceibacterota bacterium]|nr:hypothetical protein [Candidatus Paceibacterota bacterium]
MNTIRSQTTSVPSTLRSGIDVSFYLEMQKQLFEVFLFVACGQKNFDVFSVKLTSLLLEAGSFFDSLSQSFIRDVHKRGESFGVESNCGNFEAKARGEQNFTMADYRIIFEHRYQFSTLALNLNPYGGDSGLSPLLYRHEKNREFLINPFDAWKDDRALDWWSAFTTLKHDRTANLEKATLRNTLRAFGGAFLVLCFFHEEYLKNGRAQDAFHLFTPHHWKLKSLRMRGDLIFE